MKVSWNQLSVYSQHASYIYIVALVWTHPDNITFLLNLLELCQITKCMISVREFKSQAAKLYVWLADKA